MFVYKVWTCHQTFTKKQLLWMRNYRGTNYVVYTMSKLFSRMRSVSINIDIHFTQVTLKFSQIFKNTFVNCNC